MKRTSSTVENDDEKSFFEKNINRKMLGLDCDFICSTTLSTSNVYCCLACGKFFQGRGKESPAYMHALQEDHQLYICLTSLDYKIYQLPENIMIDSPFLNDIKHEIFPLFDSVDHIDEHLIKGNDLHGKPFVTGFIGINNLKANDYENVVILLLSHIVPIRNIFLQTDFRSSNNLILKNFGSFMRKLWNPKPFKAGLNPHELLHAIRIGSNDRFDPAKKGDPVEVLAWLLNSLDASLNASGSAHLVQKYLQGKIRSIKVLEDKRVSEPEADMMEFYASIGENLNSKKTIVKQVPFLFLSLDLPPTPLFQNASGKFVIPQVQILDLLAKYNGNQTITAKDGSLQSFEIESQPRKYLITVIKRLVKNHNGQLEKNQTVVNFPLRELQVSSSNQVCKYDLVANISHLGTVDSGEYVIYLKHRGSGKWFLIHDLEVKEIAPQTIFLTDTYIQLWERTDSMEL